MRLCFTRFCSVVGRSSLSPVSSRVCWTPDPQCRQDCPTHRTSARPVRAFLVSPHLACSTTLLLCLHTEHSHALTLNCGNMLVCFVTALGLIQSACIRCCMYLRLWCSRSPHSQSGRLQSHRYFIPRSYLSTLQRGSLSINYDCRSLSIDNVCLKLAFLVFVLSCRV